MNDQREFAPLLEIFPQGLVALDLETTGLSPLIDRIIELAAIKVTKEGVTVFDTLIDPKIAIPDFTTDIHGIRDEDVNGKPFLSDVLPQFKEFIGELPLIAHNAKFDAGFLVFAAHQQKFELTQNDFYCTVKASRAAFPEMPNHKLGTVAKELDLPLENHHRATDDALASLHLFNKALAGDKVKKVLKDSYMFKLSDFKKNKFPPLPEKLQVLRKKVESQVLIDIKYKGGSHKGKYRPIKPVALLPMPEGNILYGLCLLSNLYKSFSLLKIQDIKELNAEEIAQRYKNLKEITSKNS
ncbi:MAG: hypothetical protein CME63_14190 [Halobacteriovoraceae bacterium]|nr:hypothetical protein [Halobacteriovoraceae bacterium]MBC98890.1 hypothetical protein [Halobacteriovoraceae bacterium]|tara:strand:+ start:1491 stop:2381 length:891 start_codon:yes stop_codon:yes gene_type:complete